MEKEYCAQLKRRTLLVLERMAGRDTRDDVAKIDDYILSLVQPQRYDGAQGMEVRFIKAFEEACTVLGQYISRNPKEMTVLEYLNALEVIRTQNKAQQKQKVKQNG